MPMMDRRHLLKDDCGLLRASFVTLHVPDPYEETDFTLVLNNRCLVSLDIVLDFHTGLRIVNAALA